MKQKEIKHLKRGGILIYPTETAYALGCDATNQKAVDFIFKIKHRPKNKSLPLIAGSLAMVRRYCRLSAAEERLAKRYWPGAVTLVLKIKNQKSKIKNILARGVVAKDGTIAVRVSSNKIARELSRRLGRPIVSTSANLSGQGECYSVAGVTRQLKNVGTDGRSSIQIINGGRLKKRKPSTMVRVKNGMIEVVRQGEIVIGDKR